MTSHQRGAYPLYIALGITALVFIVGIGVLTISSRDAEAPNTPVEVGDSEQNIPDTDFDQEVDTVATSTEDVEQKSVEDEVPKTQVTGQTTIKKAATEVKQIIKNTSQALSDKDEDENNLEDATLEELGVVGACGLQVTSHNLNDEVLLPLTLEGTVRTIPDEDEDCQWNIDTNTLMRVQLAYEDPTCERALVVCEDGYRIISEQEQVNFRGAASTTMPFIIESFGELPEQVVSTRKNIKVIFTDISLSKKNFDSFELPLVINPNLAQKHDCGFRVTSLAPDDIINFPVTVTGDIDNSDPNAQCSWNIEAGYAGTAQLYFENGDEWTALGSSTPITVKNTEANNVKFSTKLSFSNIGVGLSLGSELKIVFSEQATENQAVINKVEIPIVLGTQSLEDNENLDE